MFKKVIYTWVLLCAARCNKVTEDLQLLRETENYLIRYHKNSSSWWLYIFAKYYSEIQVKQNEGGGVQADSKVQESEWCPISIHIPLMSNCGNLRIK